MKLFHWAIIFCYFISLAGCSQHIAPSQTELKKLLLPDIALKTGILKNGLKYSLRENQIPSNEVEFRLVVNAGSIHESDRQLGAAHFIEHMAFNGSENFSKNDVIEFFRSTGSEFGPDLNATTGYEQTVYKFKIPADKPELISRAFIVLKDWASGIRFDPEDVNSERNIIIEEWRMRKSAWERSWKKFMPDLYNHSIHARRHPIGDVDVIRSISPEELKRFYNTWYRPDRMEIVIVGDISVPIIEEKLITSFNTLKTPGDFSVAGNDGIPPHKETKFQLVRDPEMTEPSILVYQKYKRHPDVSERDFRLKLMNGLYVSILHRRINTKDPLQRSYKNAGYHQCELSPEVACHYFHISVKGHQFRKNLHEIFQEAERLKRYGVFESELEREKKVILHEAKSAYDERQNKESDDHAADLVKSIYLSDTKISDETRYRLTEKYLPTIGIADINDLRSRYNRPSDRVIGIFFGAGAPDELIDGSQVNKMYRAVQLEPLTPYLDEVSDLPLFPEQLEKGSIIKETVIEEIDVTVWELSNGGKVYLKPTDFKEGEILFRLSSPGGLSILRKEDIRTVYLMGKVVEKSGIGPFKRSDLIKRLIFKDFKLAPFTNAYEHGYWGSTSKEDIETTIKVMRLMLTQPRFNEDIFEEEKQDLIEELKDKQETANWKYWQALRTKSIPNNPYNQLVTAAEIEKLTSTQTRSALLRLLENRGDFSLVIVGAFNIDELRPIIETYIASYPVSPNPPAINDLNLEAVKGKHRFALNENIEEKSQVFVRISHLYDYTVKRAQRFWAISQALQIRIAQNLREKQGLIYAGSATGEFMHDIKPNSYIYFHFDCAPKNVEKVISGLKEILEEFRNSPPKNELIEKIKKAQNNILSKAEQTNQFWRTYIGFQVSFNQRLGDLANFKKHIGSLAPETFHKSTKKYLDDENFFVYVLNPKTTP
jgi:zinc protease